MRQQEPSWAGTRTRQSALGLLFLVPALHPLLIPIVGVPSHLLWWVHVLPVALLTFQGGKKHAAASLTLSAILVAGGEALFGGGYGVPATPATISALTIALSATNLLVAFFALYARSVSRRYRILFERVGMGVIQVGADDTVSSANPAATEFLGIGSPDSIIGRPVSEVICVPGHASLRSLETLGAWTGQLEIRVGQSRRSTHALLAAAIDPEKGSYQLFLADRTTEAMQQQEIERQAKLSSLGEALAGVAHELNNPLSVILAHAQLAQLEASEGKDPDELLEVIVSESDRMRHLVAELVGFSRQEEMPQRTNLDDILERIVRVQRITLGKRVAITCHLRSEATVSVSPHKIEQIVLNLMSNAAYAVRQGGSEITVTARTAGQHAHVEVRDDGPGIADDIRDRLFEAFATTKPEGEGTGLGLAISRRLARAWGGDLIARNVEPTGASFELRLPLLPDAEPADAPGREEQLAAPLAAG